MFRFPFVGLLVIPVSITFYFENYDNWYMINDTMNIVFLCDIVIWFFTGYYDYRTKVIVLNPRIVALYVNGSMFPYLGCEKMKLIRYRSFRELEYWNNACNSLFLCIVWSPFRVTFELTLNLFGGKNELAHHTLPLRSRTFFFFCFRIYASKDSCLRARNTICIGINYVPATRV